MYLRSMLKKNVRILFRVASVCSFLIVLEVQARPNIVVPDVHRQIHARLQEEQETNALFQNMVDSINNLKRVEADEPFELYPALDLYTSWDDAHVDPLRDKAPIPIPAEKDIDLSHFVAPIKGRINSPYGWRRRRMHKGVDIQLYKGDTVRAAFSGRVRIRKFERRGYGYYLVLRHSNGLETVYGHLSRFLVNQDDLVSAGQPIALGGSTGRSTGPHLHLEFRFMGIAIDPAKILDLQTFEPRNPQYHFIAAVEQKAQMGKAGRYSRSRTGGKNTAANSGNAFHKVRKGDTLGSIARRYGTSVSKLCRLNGLRSGSTLRIGQKIRYR